MSSISAFAFVDMPDPIDPAGFSIELQVRSLLYGCGIEHDINLMNRAGKVSAHPTRTTLDWLLEVRDKAAIRSAVGLVISPPFVGDPESCEAAQRMGDAKWMKKAAARAFVILQILSMLPLKDRLTAQWDGKPIVEAAVKGAQTRAKQAAKGEQVHLHRDAMVHFWISELQRLQLAHLTVPLVKLH